MNFLFARDKEAVGSVFSIGTGEEVGVRVGKVAENDSLVGVR